MDIATTLMVAEWWQEATATLMQRVEELEQIASDAFAEGYEVWREMQAGVWDGDLPAAELICARLAIAQEGAEMQSTRLLALADEASRQHASWLAYADSFLTEEAM